MPKNPFREVEKALEPQKPKPKPKTKVIPVSELEKAQPTVRKAAVNAGLRARGSSAYRSSTNKGRKR